MARREPEKGKTMLLPKLSSARTTAIASVTALAIALTSAAPAQALGRNERNFLKGVAATLIIGALINNQSHARPAPAPEPQRRYVPRDDRYQPRQDHYQPRHDQPAAGRVIGSQSSVYSTHAARAFNSLSLPERRLVQSRLRAYGYYAGSIDGAFGPGTYGALVAYARDTSGERQLSTVAGAYGVLDSLLA